MSANTPGRGTAGIGARTAGGLAPSRAALANGAVILAKEARATPAVTINLSMRAGSACDPPGGEGTAWLLSRVIDRGTATRPASVIAEELDSRGITVSVNVTRHLTSIVCTCLADDFDAVLTLLGDVVIAPTFPDDEVATRKGEVITAIRQDEDNPAVVASEGLMERLYPGGHPYGRRTKGTVDIVEALTRPALVTAHAANFAPPALIAAIVGDVDAPRMIDSAARVFGSWRHDPPAPWRLPAVARAARRSRTVLPMMNKSQADIAYGFTTIRRDDPDYYACWVMNVAFGQYAIGGRLGDSIRERQGMAYYVSSSLDANVAEGPLAIRAGVSPANVDRAIASIDEEIARLVADGLTARELDESRRYLIGSMPRALETSAAIANFLVNEEFFGLGLDYDRRLPDLIGAVSIDAANAAARRLLDANRATIVVAGPYQEPVGTEG
jgi:zinc protease